jgi:choline dehydrogenase
LGFADINNLNSETIPVDVCAIVDVAIDENKRRVSSYHAFLPAEIAQARREHLKVCTNAVATRIEFEAGVAVGVVFESSRPTDEAVAVTYIARAKKEIVVCCGALGSPQLLLLRLVSFSRGMHRLNFHSAVSVARRISRNMGLRPSSIFPGLVRIW